jgi:hypothetical protein
VKRDTIPNLAPSYQTRSTYQLAEPSWFDLPPPTWNLDDDTLTPLTPQVTRQRRKKANKRKPNKQPLEHKYTHATFCQDLSCVYHY